MHCDTTNSTRGGFCDRVCGPLMCKDGTEAVSCDVDPCNTRKLCPGSISCVSTSRGGECKALYYDEMGSVITDCDPDFTTTDAPEGDASAGGSGGDSAEAAPYSDTETGTMDSVDSAATIARMFVPVAAMLLVVLSL